MSYIPRQRQMVMARKCKNCKSQLHGIPGSGAYEGVVCKNCNVCNGVCSGKHCKSPNSLGYLVKHGMIYNGNDMMALSKHYYFRCSDCLEYEKNKCVFCDGDDGTAVSNQNDLIFDIICESCYTIISRPPCERCKVSYSAEGKTMCEQCDKETFKSQPVILLEKPVCTENTMFKLQYKAIFLAIDRLFVEDVITFPIHPRHISLIQEHWHKYRKTFLQVITKEKKFRETILAIRGANGALMIQSLLPDFPMLEDGKLQIEQV
jgi:hypothetical protein